MTQNVSKGFTATRMLFWKPNVPLDHKNTNQILSIPQRLLIHGIMYNALKRIIVSSFH